MRLASPIALALLCLLPACKDGNTETTDDPTTTTGGTSTTTESTPTTTLPDTTTSTTTTGEPDTTTEAESTTTTGNTTSPPMSCVDFEDKNSCEFMDGCQWSSVFQYTHGSQGCEGDVIDFCVATTLGESTSWYRGDQVIQFDYVPTDLGPEWKQCDCDGPLACFCSINAPECPDRLPEFCGATTTELGCNGSLINGEFVCEWFRISPEGPKDDDCTTDQAYETCLPATNAGSEECEDYIHPYPQMCTNIEDPTFWREVDGVIEVTTACGPIPPSPEWTECGMEDTPEQPDECKCLCQ